MMERSLVALVLGWTLAAPPARAWVGQRRQDAAPPGVGPTVKAGWQLVVRDGCRFAVPATWRAASDETAAFAPDGSSFSVRLARFPSWPLHKTQIRAAFGHVKLLHEDSERRLWFEIGDGLRTQHYIDVATSLGSCLGLLEIRTAGALNAEDTNRIADSLGEAPAHGPPDSRDSR